LSYVVDFHDLTFEKKAMKKLRNPDRDEHIKKAIRNARWQPIAARYPKVKSIYRDPQGKGSIAQLVHRVKNSSYLTSVDLEARDMRQGLAGTETKKYSTSIDAEKQLLAKLKETQTK
jgi:hypothetical protein